MQLFESQASSWRDLTHAEAYNSFYTQRHLVSRATLRTFRSEAHTTWAIAIA